MARSLQAAWTVPWDVSYGWYRKAYLKLGLVDKESKPAIHQDREMADSLDKSLGDRGGRGQSLVWPDRSGFFPWEPNLDSAFASEQPDLTIVSWTGLTI